MNKIQILNVRLPFIEAIDFLKNDDNVIACVCITNDRPCTITMNECNELKIIQTNLFDNLFNERLLNIDNILSDEYNLVIKIL